MACFRMVPLYAMPTHRVMNLFLKGYITEWLDYEESLGVKLIEDVTSGALLKDLSKSYDPSSSSSSPSAAAGVAGTMITSGTGECSPGSATHPTETGQKSSEDSATSKPDPLTQLLTALCRSASEQAPDDPLYLAYAKIMGKVRLNNIN
ncbi:unnamed protein product [Trichobilharzia regenti]|nr:unnamed protein product [Trichobilharzia regenti]